MIDLCKWVEWIQQVAVSEHLGKPPLSQLQYQYPSLNTPPSLSSQAAASLSSSPVSATPSARSSTYRLRHQRYASKIQVRTYTCSTPEVSQVSTFPLPVTLTAPPSIVAVDPSRLEESEEN